MLDSFELEAEGVPTVTIVTDWFVDAAKMQAELLGMPGLRIVPLRYVGKGGQGHWMSREEREAMIDSRWGELIGALLESPTDHE